MCVNNSRKYKKELQINHLLRQYWKRV